MMDTNLPARLHQAFARTGLPADVRLFVVRRDGLMVWDGTPDDRSQPLAALCGGMWEASFAMARTAGAATSPSGFRLVFDDAAAGVLVYPLTVHGETYFLGGIYRDCVNPARLRHRVQELRGRLEGLLAEGQAPVAAQAERAGYLFADITDAEMDRLFGIGV